jgi:hypothetical protein
LPGSSCHDTREPIDGTDAGHEVREPAEEDAAAEAAGEAQEARQATMNAPHPAWTLIGLGGLLVLAGLVWLVLPSIPWLGRLPGDVAIERERVRFYFPIVTCLLLSVVLTLLSRLIQYFRQ